MPEEIISQKIKLKKKDETRNYLIEEINQNKLMSKKHKKVCRVLNYIDHSLFVILQYWMRFYFCFCFFSWYSFRNDIWYSYRNYKFCNWIRHL